LNFTTEPNKIETKAWTDDTTTFNLALIGKIDPKSKGAFRVGGAKTEVLQRVDTQNIDHGVLSEISRKSATPPDSETITEAASSTLKESLKQRPLYDRGEAMQKTDHLVEEGKFIGTPEETYEALTGGLSPEKKQVFDQLLGLFSEVVANEETNSMHLSNLAIAFGPTLFPEGSSEGMSPMEGIAFAGENTKRQTALFENLIEYAASQNAIAPAEATPEEGRVFTDDGLKARIAALEEKEDKSLEEIEPEDVYAALTEGLSDEQKALFDGEIESLRDEAKNKEILGGKPYESWKQTEVDNPARSLIVLLIDSDRIQNTPLGLSSRSPKARETNKILVDKLLRVDKAKVPEEGRVFTGDDLKARIATLEEKEGKSLKEIEPGKVYTALTEGLSGRRKALFNKEMKALRAAAMEKQTPDGSIYYESMIQAEAQSGGLVRLNLSLVIETEAVQDSPLGLSDSEGREAYITNSILVDKLLRVGS